ncbi:MAG: HlyD family efflux transporter periplasmic adaptor subunit [Acetobacteraceae bacterium]|nr:HlyD family efflux transporter periplasmic adaptor subunit [Acetobacteraceae bacterium]MBV8592048.1 HlyD family efflux transporter periplasmic adaptor subunit [Acetobacteraceae bacterium]
MGEFRLFRDEAVAFQRDPVRAAEASPAAAPSAAALTWLLAAMVAAALFFLFSGSYARKETVSGFLAPTLGIAKVYPPRAGLIVSVDVRDGQLVEQGALLLTVQVGQSDGHGADVDASIQEALSRQRAALAEQIGVEESRARAEASRIADRIDGLGREITTLQAQLATQRARTQVAEDQVTAVRELLAKGDISVVEFRRRQDNFLAQRESEAALAGQIVQKLNEAAQERHAQDELPGQLAAKLATSRASIADLDARIAELAGRHAYQLRAPLAGRVSALQARVGLIADPAIPQLAIVPARSVLEAQLLVPARAIGFVAPGQLVRLAYTPFPYQRFGLYRAHVETVSDTLLRPSELLGPIAASDPSYRVTVALERQSIEAFGRSFPLGPDMTLRAEIVLDRRSLLDWVLDPLYSLRGRAK